MKIILTTIYFFFQLSAFALKPSEFYNISSTGIINCFSQELNLVSLDDKNFKSVSCEPSAVVFSNHNLIFGNDKNFNNDNISAIFSIDYRKEKINNLSNIKYFFHKNTSLVKKIEDFTLAFNKKYILATTSFDRDDENFEYNSIIYWNSKGKREIKFLEIKENNEIYSRDIKKYLSKVLNKTYFKIEGLAVTPNNKLIFGVRELGESYKNFSYVITLVSVSIFEENKKLYLSNDFKLFYNFNNANKYVQENVGISSLTWDSFNNKLLVLTSYETNDKVGAYLWTLSLDDISHNFDMVLAMKNNSEALKFNHKAEGVTVINKNKFFIIHDDDRKIIPDFINGKIYYRKMNEAYYNTVDLEKLDD